MRRYAFVLPRFGEGIVGGAETLAGELARQLKLRGDHVEVWTTCARDNRTWENAFPPGKTEAFGVSVTRFLVDERNLDVWVPLQIRLADGMSLSLEDQFSWLENGVNSRQLYGHIANNASSFDAIFFAPYLFATTFWGSLVRPEKSWLIPCLHDEHYAYVESIASMFRKVGRCLFNALPEQELAERLYGPLVGAEVGMGFDTFEESYLQTVRPYFSDSFPYLVYFGRKETGKNAQLLIDNFVGLKSQNLVPHDLKLVIAGGGSFSDLERDSVLLRGDIVDLAQVSEEEKQRLLRHAVALCQPSQMESFSIVLMEAWRAGTPVIVHADCPVTSGHVINSGGGLYFRSPEDFYGAARELIQNPALREALAQSGKDYVATRYSWETVLAHFDALVGSNVASVTHQKTLQAL